MKLAERILEHMREFRANARVCILGPTDESLEYLRSGPDGILRAASKEYTTAEPSRQITHRQGGTIRFFVPGNAKGLIGPQWSMVVIDGIADQTAQPYKPMITDAMLGLRMEPRALITSRDGQIEGQEGSVQ
jgi:phage terminase large subunit-like protein